MESSTKLLIYALWMLVFPELFTVFHEGEAAHPVKRFTGLYTGPYFDPTATTNITTQLGTHAYIPCKIKQLGNKSVSWIRRRDAHILTVDRYTFIADDRFQAFFVEATDTWTLQVKYVQARDAGQYECQVSTEPKMSHFITLNVVVPKIEIEGESDIYVKRGSTVQLKCVITQSLEEPAYIFWYHDGERVLKAQDQAAIDIRMTRQGTDTTISTITIFRTKPEDAGNYTCSPSNLDSASAYLHVLNDINHPSMEFPSTGESCSETSCKRLDFLPLVCSSCGLKFCSEHLRLHIRSCRSKMLGLDELKRIVEVHVCSHPGCGERSVVPLLCGRCGRHFCVSHRHVGECESKTLEALEKEKERYTEPVRRFNEAKAAVDEKVANCLAEAKKNPKTRSTAAKIQLMKIKQKAVGPKTIPTMDRLYLDMTDPSGKTLAIFVSKNWTVGRCIDAMAQELRLVNNNNRVTSRKLRLFRDGAILMDDISVVLSNLVEDGDQLVIDYVRDS